MSKQQDQYLEALRLRRERATAAPPPAEPPPEPVTPVQDREGETGGSLSDTLRQLQHKKRRTWR
jgi:hypothetical protein